jgi:chromosome segregation ATPase
MPGVAASVIVRSRQRQQQVHRQLERGKLRLHELQHRGAILNEQLQVRDKDRQEIELRVSQLHSLAANLTARLDRDRDRHQQLEQQLSALTIYCQEQQDLGANLDRKIQDKQASLLEVDTDLNILKLEFSQIQAAQIQLKGARVGVASPLENQARISLTDIQIQIDQNLATKQALELQIQQLQSQKVVEAGDLDKSIEQKHLRLNELDLAISNREKDRQDLAIEVDRLNNIIADKIPELTNQEQKLAETRSQLSDTELALQAKQVQFDELVAKLSIENEALEERLRQREDSLNPLSDQMLQRELRIAQLELNSRQAELDNLELKIHSKLRLIDEIDLENNLQILEPQPPKIDRDIDTIAVTGAWYDKFIDNPHLTVLKHIEKHGTITEAEASSKLGNARSVRQFANKLEEYAQDLPFSIRVESSPKGNRYLKEDRN